MSRKLQFVMILCVAVAICSGISHFAVHRLKIFADYGVRQDYGSRDQEAVTILNGSSLAYSGVDWEKVCGVMGNGIQSWATAGSSPAEWEVLSRRSPDTTRAFIVVSAYDLNEYWLCDFRANIVPLGQTVRDLWQRDVDWQFSKRIISQYAVMLVRKVFPTVGRSDAVMAGIRDAVEGTVYGRSRVEATDDPKFGPANTSEVREKLTDWSPARLQRRLVLMRTKCQGIHSFEGLKRVALARLLKRASKQGEVLLLVMPVSPTYQREFLTPNVTRQFEQAIAEIQHDCPEARLIRVDQVATLQDDQMFQDLVHLNTEGQRRATAVLLKQLESRLSKR